jgi:hypothetical protein
MRLPGAGVVGGSLRRVILALASAASRALGRPARPTFADRAIFASIVREGRRANIPMISVAEDACGIAERKLRRITLTLRQP